MEYILKFGKIDKSLSEQVVKRLNRLKENPENIGKPLLHTKPTLWEFKVGPFRIFYIIQENLKEIWLLSLKHKDECESYIKIGYSRDINEF